MLDASAAPRHSEERAAPPAAASPETRRKGGDRQTYLLTASPSREEASLLLLVVLLLFEKEATLRLVTDGRVSNFHRSLRDPGTYSGSGAGKSSRTESSAGSATLSPNLFFLLFFVRKSSQDNHTAR